MALPCWTSTKRFLFWHTQKDQLPLCGCILLSTAYKLVIWTNRISWPLHSKTSFGWVLPGPINSKLQLNMLEHHIIVHHCIVLTTDDLHKFWKVKKIHSKPTPLSHENKVVLTHFQYHHRHDSRDRFIVPLPSRQDAKMLGETQFQVVYWFLLLERVL